MSSDFYRIRISDYRVIYPILDNILLIEIIKIGHRKEVYR
ncbi:MAG: type II toxin-antitoxin system RelE/ParE family toxin [Ignavibacteria bacterium]|nr:type II toxin-antitoxin system RelE/ParE family toxin [Ignavibacteria bacterium]